MTGSNTYSPRGVMLRVARLLTPDERLALRQLLREKSPLVPAADEHGVATLDYALLTLDIFSTAIEADHNILAAVVLDVLYSGQPADEKALAQDWGDDIASLVMGQRKVRKFSFRDSVTDQDNYRRLLLSLTDDVRVIIIMIVRSLALMRLINRHPDEAWVKSVAFEANCLYAQLAHRLGLYKIKGELEDLSLKYSNRDIYTQIARKLNETKRERDAYIENFIAPVKRKLTEAGLRFEIKGRTKSISSIWAKIQKQKVDLGGIYDLFAIRVIIDTPREREKRDCWLAYSIVADMYTANPARMKDWISIPKSNGYESLHATVSGPEGKWVEVQFRTRRMDLVAEKGLAAHWRYKGGKPDAADKWMNNIRDILETAGSGPMQLMKNVRLDVYSKEVFAFTPKGDLLRLSPDSTILDFAFAIHTNVGSHCTGGIVNGSAKKINYKIKSGDTIEIKTSPSQKPTQDWLNIVKSAKAKNKIRQSLNEEKTHLANAGREMFERRARNRKVEIDEATLMLCIKRAGYKTSTDFFADMGSEVIDAGKFLTQYQETLMPEQERAERTSADEFKIRRPDDEDPEAFSDVLIIGDKNIRGMNYRFAKCCSPIAGDDVFGFISSDGIVKIHKADCPNARNIRERYPYRVINVKWSGISDGGVFAATLKVVGIDDIGIVTNITSIISKESSMSLRNIAIDSHDGMFQGFLTVKVRDTQQLSQLIKKIRTIKGVKDVTRN